MLYNLIEGIRICAVMLYPFIPESAEKIMGELTHPENADKLSLEDWKNASEFGHEYADGSRVNPTPSPLFMRIDEKEFMAKLEADRTAAEKADKAAKKDEEPEVTEIGIEDFLKVRLICAQILECEPVPKSDKLLKIIADDGEGKRQIVSGIAASYKPEELIGKKVILVSNLKPAKLRGVESNGMLLAAGTDNGIVVSFLDDSVRPGTVIR